MRLRCYTGYFRLLSDYLCTTLCVFFIPISLERLWQADLGSLSPLCHSFSSGRVGGADREQMNE
jgi:hypothetical protein